MTQVDPQRTSPSDATVAADSSAAEVLSELEFSEATAGQSNVINEATIEATIAPESLDDSLGDALAIAPSEAVVAVIEVPDKPTEAKAKPKLTQRLQRGFKTTAQGSLRRLKHRPTQLLLLGAAATFALGGATSYLLRRPANGPSSLESAMALVPNSAVASLTLNPKTEPWRELRQLGTPNLQQGLGAWLAVGRDRLVNLGYGNLSEIQQQLAGPPVMALVPVNAATQPLPGQPPQANPSDLLIVAPLKNPKAVARSLDERQPPEGFDNTTANHRGVKIWDLQVDLVQRQSVAIFGNFGLLASNRTTLERALDSYQDGTALEDLNEYEDAQRRLGPADLNSADGALMSFYINGPAAVLSNQAAGRLLPLPAALQGLVSQVRVTDGDELALSTVAWDKTAAGLGVLAQPAPGLGDKPKAMVALGDRFPASTSFLLSGSSLQEAWRSFSQAPASNSLLSPATLQQQVQAVTSMDLQQDWLSWMDGPYSVGILPIPTQANSRFQTGLTFMVQTSNRRLGERSLQKLDALMVNKYGLRLSTSKLDGQPVVNWANANGEAVVTHGWLEGNIAFLIVGAPGANLLLPQPRATLAASRLYREGMPREAAKDPSGVMFVDVDRVLDTQLPSLLPLTPSSRPVLEQLKSIGVERRPLDERFSLYDLNLKFLPRSAAPPVEEPASVEEAPLEAEAPEGTLSESGISTDEALRETEDSDSTASDSATSQTDLPEPNPDAQAEQPEATPSEPLQSETTTADVVQPEVVTPEVSPADGSPDVEKLDEPSAADLPEALTQSQVEQSGSVAVEDEPLGPILPEIFPVFGPQFRVEALELSEASDRASGNVPATAPDDSPTTDNALAAPAEDTEPVEEAKSADEAELVEAAEPIAEADANSASVKPPREEIIIDPRTVIKIGPPSPPRGFDFAPVGPKYPRPAAQQWSGDFTQPVGE